MPKRGSSLDEEEHRIRDARKAELARVLAQPSQPAGLVRTPQCHLDSWEIIRELGRGGFSTVFEARDLSGAPCALKIMATPVDPRLRSRFRQEGEVARSLRHPNLVRVRRHGQLSDGRCYLEMELVPGVSAGTLLALHGEIELGMVVRIAQGVVAGLEALHAGGLVYRDLKPGNVMVDAEQVKLVDLGLCKSGRQLTASQEIIGTLPYLAPEILRQGSRHARPCDDVFSLGVMIYELITGTHPWPLQPLETDHRPSPKRPSAIREAVPPELDALVHLALALRPERLSLEQARELLSSY